MSLNVMVLESERGAAAPAAEELRAAGHAVWSCHDEGAPAFPCRGLADPAQCPLMGRPVDVALVVRPLTRAQPTAREDGVRCALMRRVPVVVAGSPLLSPYEAMASRSIARTYDIVGECEEAARAPIGIFGARAATALDAVLGDVRAAEVGARVAVTREAGRLQVHVEHGARMTKDERARAGVAILAALRACDPFADGIDVMIDGADAAAE